MTLFGCRYAHVQVVANQDEHCIPIQPELNGEQGSQRAVDEIVIPEIGEIEIHYT